MVRQLGEQSQEHECEENIMGLKTGLKFKAADVK